MRMPSISSSGATQRAMTSRSVGYHSAPSATARRNASTPCWGVRGPSSGIGMSERRAICSEGVVEVIHEDVTTLTEQRKALLETLDADSRRSMHVRLIVVRHAQPRPVTTLAEDGLTDGGRAQAVALGLALATPAPSRVVVSPTPRATETAERAGLPFEVDAAFEKFNYGGGEVRERHQAGSPLWRPGHRASPDGESLQEFHERAAAGFRGLIEGARGDETVVVIAHGGIIQVALRYAWG